MTPRNILCSTLIALVTMTLIAAPAAAAAPDRGDESPRWTWMADLGDLVERVSGRLFGERASQRQRDEAELKGGANDALHRISAADGSTQGSGLDPNG